MARPLKFSEPCSFTTCAPLCAFGCQRQNDAPFGVGDHRHATGLHHVEGLHRRATGITSRSRSPVDVVDPDVGVPRGHRRGAVRDGSDGRHVTPADPADVVAASGALGHHVLELPPEQAPVEPDRGVGVRLVGVDPAGHARDVAISFGHGVSPISSVRQPPYLPRRTGHHVAGSAQLLYEREARASTARGTRDRAEYTPEEIDRYVEEWSQEGAATGMINYYRSSVRQSPKAAEAALRPISAPTLVIRGERDSYLGSDRSQRRPVMLLGAPRSARV